MKLYSIFDLYVIKNGEHKFICKKCAFDNYREIFTKEKIKISDLNQVKPLSNYYPILSAMKPEKLSKEQILQKYIEINQKENDKEKEILDSFAIDAWQDYVEDVKGSMPEIPVINVKELIKK